MKGLTITTIVLAAMLGVTQEACATNRPLDDASIRLQGNVNCPFVSSRGGTVYVQLQLETGMLPRRDRRPLNVAVVVDRSGSMAAEGKIENAKAALRAVIDQLRRDDIISIVIYDDEVDVLRPAGRVGNKEDLRRLVEEITPRGWTNLGGGMVEGFRQAHSYARRGTVSRVILLSDGLANRGITDPRALGNIACRERGEGISLSTIGVGLDYNENVMLALSESGGGNYYFLESSRNLASALEKEFTTVCGVLAQDARIDITLGRGVKVIDAIGCPYKTSGRDLTLEAGDLNAGEKKEWTLVLDVPAGEGTMEVARGRLHYHSAIEGLAEARVEEFQTGIRYTERLAEVDDHRDKDIQAKGDVALSTRKVEQAMQALDDGRRDEAEKQLRDARQMMAASPAAIGSGASAEMVRAQENKLSDYSTTLKEQDAGKAKKDIQYDNYRTQKKKK